MPVDPRTVIDAFNLNPVSKTFVCCPKCFSCYPLDDSHSYPERCPFKSTPDAATCNRLLRKTRSIRGKRFVYPARHFLYHDMKQWVGNLLCRDGMEDILDRELPACHDQSAIHDILETKLFREFLGPDDKPLCMDGFNPYHMKEAGKKNLFLVGIIPGPGAPLLEQINHNDLLVFWNSGVYYASTPNHRNGHCVWCAVIPLICDLPAARQMSGYAHFSSRHFCSLCCLRLEEINDLDRSHWLPRTCQEHRHWAERWRNAPSEKERKNIFDMHGLRWSELLRLPRHCRDIWGMDIKLKDGDGTWVDSGAATEFDKDSDALLQDAWETLRHGTINDMQKLTRSQLQRLCRDTQMLPEPRYIDRKKHLLKKLEQYRQHHPETIETSSLGPVPQIKRRKVKKNDTVVLGAGVLAEVQRDMARTRLPYWVSPAPREAGSTRVGKLSADQWRSFCTIHLVVTLGRIWGPSDPTSRFRKMLDNYMDLVTAVKVASMRTMTPARIASYNLHMDRYLKNVLELYPQINLTLNHHLSAHFGELLQRFGPTHAWRCWIFERINYMLQQIPTNKKFDELEKTMFENFCIAQSLRSLITSGQLPDVLSRFVDVFTKTFRDDRSRGTLISESRAFKVKFSVKPDSMFSAIQRWKTKNNYEESLLLGTTHSKPCSPVVKVHHSLEKDGILYKPHTTPGQTEPQPASGTLLSAFNTSSDDDTHRLDPNPDHPGRIREILTHESQTLIIVDPFRALAPVDVHHDHYRTIFYDEPDRSPVIISPTELMCHVALVQNVSDGIVAPHCLTIPLYRMRFLDSARLPDGSLLHILLHQGYRGKSLSATLAKYIFSKKYNFIEGRDASAQPVMLARFLGNFSHTFTHVGYGAELGIPGMIVEGEERDTSL
ncbi:uncharacterized protein F5891DRAFT_1232191 [Suillus fuscotomentosus]|uniref:DUF4218 domain-containing protein n=1 Tax=Suillus fuscotomentosus TaxID=1912939 RepID=A0AAD4DPU3_9AGAM|nr:uncharacterized protein F5891DRAFT_1232191 [Suillus fuscotomentosus]KAG1885889.1 hypothetical protein F5891DRAFT_1232191 [Suillus fuscotomentosus]